MINPIDVVGLNAGEIKFLFAFKKQSKPYLSALQEIIDLSREQVAKVSESLLIGKFIEVIKEKKDLFVSLVQNYPLDAAKKILELRVWDALHATDAQTVNQLFEELKEDKNAVNIAVANLKKAGIIDILKGGIVTKTAAADISLFELQQGLIERLAKSGTCNKNELSDKEWEIVNNNLKKRGKASGIFDISEVSDRQFQLTAQGQDALKTIMEKGLTGEEISQITPEILQSGSWRSKHFRQFNLKSAAPRIVFGKKNPYKSFLDFVKLKLIALGFEEMKGPIVESEFWNMDALFMPQFHSARDVHDAYFIKSPTHCKEIKEPNFTNVSITHESGGVTGSRGWQYRFDKERTKRLVLRSQGTALSIRQLSNKPNIPGRYFGIARCFRYDQVDKTHAPDFFQVEGIILGKEINFKHLLGVLKIFALEIARSKELRFVPAYFPFTEPSVEVHILHPKLGWMELGGAGIFRPEVTAPQGIDVPVIAWGLGLDRMAMIALGINDIRDLFTADLNLIRSQRVNTIV